MYIQSIHESKSNIPIKLSVDEFCEIPLGIQIVGMGYYSVASKEFTKWIKF